MKHTIPCTIETIASPTEEAWIIAIDHTTVPDAIILLTALRLGKVSQIKLTDRSQTALLRPDSLILADSAVPISAVWLDAVCAMLVNIHLKGWSNTAHLDQDFSTPDGEICICFAVTPPQSFSI